MRKLLFGVQAWDVTTLAAVSVVLAIAGLVASYIPARRGGIGQSGRGAAGGMSGEKKRAQSGITLCAS